MTESLSVPQLRDFLMSRLPQLLREVNSRDDASIPELPLLQDLIEELGRENYTPSLGFTALASLVSLLPSPSNVFPHSSRHWTVGAVAELILQLASRDPLLSRILRNDIQALLHDLSALFAKAFSSRLIHIACFCSAAAHLSQTYSIEVEVEVPSVTVTSSKDILRTATSVVDAVSFLLNSGGDFARLWICSPFLLEALSALSKMADGEEEAKQLRSAIAKALQAFVRNSSPQNLSSMLPDLLRLLIQHPDDNDISKSICGSIDYIMAVFPWQVGADIAKQLQSMLHQVQDFQSLVDYVREVLCRLVTMIARSVRLVDLDSRLIIESLCALAPASSVHQAAHGLMRVINEDSSTVADTVRSFKRGKPAYDSKNESLKNQSRRITDFLSQCSQLAGLNDVFCDSLSQYLSARNHSLGFLRTLYVAVAFLDNAQSSLCLVDAFNIVWDIQSRVVQPPIHDETMLLLLRLYQSLTEILVTGAISEKEKENISFSGSFEVLKYAFEAAIMPFQINDQHNEGAKVAIKACAVDLLWILTPVLSNEKLKQTFELIDVCRERDLEINECWLFSRILTTRSVSQSILDLIMRKLTFYSSNLAKMIFMENFQLFVAPVSLLTSFDAGVSAGDSATASKECYELIGKWAIEQKDNVVVDNLLASVIRQYHLSRTCFTRGIKLLQQKILTLCFELMRSSRAASQKAAYLYVTLSEQSYDQNFEDTADRRKFVKHLGIELQSVREDEDDLRESLIFAIGLVAIPDSDHSSAGALYPIIDSFDERLWHFPWRYVTSLKSLQKLLAEQAMTVDEAMEQSSMSIYRRIGLQMTNRPSLVESFALFICEKDLQLGVSMLLPYVLPEIAKAYSRRGNSDSSFVPSMEVLKAFSTQLNKNIGQIVVEHAHEIFASLLLEEGSGDIVSAMYWVGETTREFCQEKNSNWPNNVDEASTKLFQSTLSSLHESLLWRLSSKPIDHAITVIRELQQAISSIVTGKRDDCDTNEANVLHRSNGLKPFLLRLFYKFEGRFRKAIGIQSKMRALKCFQLVIRLSCKELRPFVSRCIIFLTLATTNEKLLDIALESWNILVESMVTNSDDSIPRFAHQIAITLINKELDRFGPELEEKRAKCLSKLFLDGNENIREELSGILQSLPRFKQGKPWQELYSHQKRLNDNEGGWLDRLDALSDALNHEANMVRRSALDELLEFLQLNRRKMMNLMLKQEVARHKQADIDIIVRTGSSLLRCVSDESMDPERLLIVRCLGELGAVDPSEYEAIEASHSGSSFWRSMGLDDWLYHLMVQHISRILRTAPDPDNLNAAAYAAQEILMATNQGQKLAQMDHRPSRSKGNTHGFWDRLPADDKEVISPFLKSKYSITTKPHGLWRPIFKSVNSFRHWLSAFIEALIEFTDGLERSIFESLRGVIRCDTPTARFLLPYVVIAAISQSSRAAMTFMDEINSLVIFLTDSKEKKISGVTSEGKFSCVSKIIQVCFSLIDQLRTWSTNRKRSLVQRSYSKHMSGTDRGVECSQLKSVEKFLAALPWQQLGKSACAVNSHARALLFVETYLRQRDISGGSHNLCSASCATFTESDLSLLGELYHNLEDSDGMEGVSSVRSYYGISQDVSTQITVNEHSGNWNMALLYCERALASSLPSLEEARAKLASCLRHHGYLHSAMHFSLSTNFGSVRRHNRQESISPDTAIDEQRAAAAWRLGDWEVFKHAQSQLKESRSFDIQIGGLLYALESGLQQRFHSLMRKARLSVARDMIAPSMESYARAYSCIVRLHILHEIEEAFQLREALITSSSNRLGAALIVAPWLKKACWEERFSLTERSYNTREALLSVRRVIFRILGASEESFQCLLRRAKLSKMAGNFQSAQLAMAEAEEISPNRAMLAKSKLLWEQGSKYMAVSNMKMWLAKLYNETKETLTNLDGSRGNHPKPLEKELEGKATLLLARWSREMGLKSQVDIVSLYRSSIAAYRHEEKAHFYFAKYFDDLMSDAQARQLGGDRWRRRLMADKADRVMDKEIHFITYIPDVLENYFLSLKIGCKLVFQSLPRLLTIWFDSASLIQQAVELDKKIHTGDKLVALEIPSLSIVEVNKIKDKIAKIMGNALNQVPKYIWLTCLAQLISRVCHNDPGTKLILYQILAVILAAYPEQCLWSTSIISKSRLSARREAADIVMNKTKSILKSRNTPSMGVAEHALQEFSPFVDHLRRLCYLYCKPNESPPKSFSIQRDCSSLKRMMPLPIIVPVQSSLNVGLPPSGKSEPNYCPFQGSVSIEDIEDEVKIMASLQRPKKIVFRGSDGNKYGFLAKPKDDLRKDARMMELNGVVNRLCLKDPPCRRRLLHIRTFAVIPLMEDTGILEWVEHTMSLRSVLQSLYMVSGSYTQSTNKVIKKMYDDVSASGHSMKIVLKEKPIMHQWFISSFPSPASWHRARKSFTTTCAIWSMLGHIVGLGDRHGENILMDSMTGDVVHVDFSCLFDKGLELEKPEVVPFRLTQNMVDGLGVLGTEGLFRLSCQVSLDLLRRNENLLMTVLHTFLYDPLVEWKNQKGRAASKKSLSEKAEEDVDVNHQAKTALGNIHGRLTGIIVGVGAAPSLPYGVEGQVSRLISEATSLENLSRMYIWWMPWF